MAREQLKIAIYARVSMKNTQDPEMQIAELREYIRNRHWKIAGEYVDKGISGASDSRSELNRLMADANRRRFDVVVVWKFDRFARSVSHLLRALETFRALGIEFVSLSEKSIPARRLEKWYSRYLPACRNWREASSANAFEQDCAMRKFEERDWEGRR
jgi:predicted site-specific integrase-resolvase